MRVLGILAVLVSLATPAAALDINTPYLKVDEAFYIGAYCHVSEGKTQALLKSALGVASLSGFPSELVKFGFDKVSMAKGDVVCFWLHVNHEKRDKLKNENRMSRRHVVNTSDRELVRKTSSFTIRVYGADKKQVGNKTGTCSEGRHCSSNIIKPSAPAAGIAMCIESQLSGSKKVSIVIAQGAIPVSSTNGKLADQGCDARKSEFEGT